MKRILLLSAVCMALAACGEKDPAGGEKEKDRFEAGQKVTFSIYAPNKTKVTSSLNAEGGVDFMWETGDKVLVTAGSATAEFTLKTMGSNVATFEGIMPAGGTSFDVRYPVREPVINVQSYSATEVIPHDMMEFTATGCHLGNMFSVIPVNASMRLNLWGSATISKIVVTNLSIGKSYTLELNGGVKLPSESGNAKPFFIVIPAGSCQPEVEIYNNAQVPVSIFKRTAQSQTLAAGEVLNMPEIEITDGE